MSSEDFFIITVHNQSWEIAPWKIAPREIASYPNPYPSPNPIPGGICWEEIFREAILRGQFSGHALYKQSVQV